MLECFKLGHRCSSNGNVGLNRSYIFQAFGNRSCKRGVWDISHGRRQLLGVYRFLLAGQK